ncbi:unnamed protein product [Calypogeia fissa]
MVLSPESPLGSGSSSRHLQGMLEKDSVKLYYNQSGLSNNDKGSRNFQVDVASENPWGAPSDLWEHDEPLMDSQGQMQLSFLDQTKGIGSLDGQNPFDSSGDSLRLDSAGMSSGNQTLQDMMLRVAPSHSLLSAGVAESPMASTLSKETSDREVKQEIRPESSDGSDPLDDDDEKGGARSGRRHLSKNLVAERKRRKKLNERLYSLRALVPKITKMDRASILGDAIEYVKELQQQVKDLQDELLDPKQDDLQLVEATASLDDVDMQQAAEDGKGTLLLDDRRGSGKMDQLDVSMEALERKADELSQPMQVEVTKIDSQLFSLRIFCEKRPGVFVKLMQNLDVLGLDIVNANITTFRGLVLNILNAENKETELLRPEQVKESLLEMSQSGGLRHGCLSGDLHPVQPPLIANANDKGI